MPIVEFHLSEGSYRDEQIGELLTAASHLYADTLKSPVERVRAVAHVHAARHVAVGGRLVSEGATPAPYFHFLVLEGRPVEQCQALLTGFTDQVVNILGAQRSAVRGGCWPIPASLWAIAGTPASVARVQEIAARAAASSDGS